MTENGLSVGGRSFFEGGHGWDAIRLWLTGAEIGGWAIVPTLKAIAPPQAETQPRSLLDVIDRFRQNMSPEELDPNVEDIWQDVRDRSPVSSEPRW